MASNRSKNAAGKARRTNSAKNAPKARANSKANARQTRIEEYREPVIGPGAANDIVGVLIAVIAVGMIIALVSPSSAVVTHAVGRALVLGFGAGAILVPIALLAFALTFFVASESPLSARVAAGLGLIVLAVLSMLSLSIAGAEQDPMLVFSLEELSAAGGYVGGGVAWLLLTLVGRTVGLVVLAGVVIAGIIVSGFSISGVVEDIRVRANEAIEERRLAREEALAYEAEQGDWYEVEEQPSARRGRGSQRRLPLPEAEDEVAPATSFIGSRKTSVLRRGASPTQTLADDEPYDAFDTYQDEVPFDEEPATMLLDRKAKGKPVEEPAPEPAPTAFDGPIDDAPLDEGEPERADVPEFIDKRRKKSSKKAKEDKAKDATTLDGALPPVTMIKSSDPGQGASTSRDELANTAQRLQSTLEEFNLTSKVTGWVSGPAVTTFKIAMGEGERVSKITNLQDDIALSLAAKSVRIFAPIPGTSLVGIEIPNKETQSVYLGDVLPYVTGGPLEAAFGRDSEGKPVVVDLAGLPHLLVAGTTGSGKSVLLNSIVMSILMRATPDEVRLIMVDPKRVEFTYYAGLPHLYTPVVTEPKQAAAALQWGVNEMERRLRVFEHYKVRDIRSYNSLIESGRLGEMEHPPTHMPYFVIVIDELADLMMVAGKDVEASIVRIAQLGRAAGIHLIVATQRPSPDVVTGLIKANIDNRVALSVDNGMNSRIILDQTGAERLLGHGDMLYKLRGRRPKRAQGCFVSEEEVASVVEFIREHHESDYHEDILSGAAASGQGTPGMAEPAEEDDPLIWEAARIVVDSQLGSTSGLQRRLKVGYARAGRIMDMLEQKGVVGPPDGSKPREVLLDADGLEELRQAESQYQEV